MLIRCSIIIPTYNASKYLPALLKSLENQTIDNSELLIVDSSSQDNTVEIAASFGARVIKIDKADFDHGRTRTLAAKESGGEFLVYLSQDCLLYDNSSIENIIKPFNDDKNIAAVCGRQLPCPDATVFAEHLRMFNYPDVSYVRVLSDKTKYGIRTAFLSNSFAAYRKDALESVGYFTEGLIFGEDMSAAAKLLLAGGKIAYTASAKVYHSHNYTIRQDFRRYFDMGVFHKNKKSLLEQFGKAEGQGWKYVKSELRFLTKQKKYGLFVPFVLRAFAKFLGYKMGQQYRLLPVSINRRLSMNRSWWNRYRKSG